MFDLRVGPAEAPSLAIEVAGAVDQERTETWNVGPAKSGRQWNVTGDWAPWSVTRYLTGSLEHLPTACPILPPNVDGVWLAPTLLFREAVGVRCGRRGCVRRYNGPSVLDHLRERNHLDDNEAMKIATEELAAHRRERRGDR